MKQVSMQWSAAEGLGNGPQVSPLTCAVERATAELVAARTLDHDRLRKPYISAQQIDEARGVGVFVLAEHIDYDGGWCGDQFRYSVWVVRRDEDPRLIYSDHSYHRAELRGGASLVGRDPRVDIIELRDDGVVVRGTGREGAPFDGEKKFSVGFDGNVRELQSFTDQARNHIEQIGTKLGYDHLSAFVEIPGKDIAAATFTSENGRDYGYDTIYLVWRDGGGGVQARSLLRTSDYSSIKACGYVEGAIQVVVAAENEKIFRIPVRDLGR